MAVAEQENVVAEGGGDEDIIRIDSIDNSNSYWLFSLPSPGFKAALKLEKSMSTITVRTLQASLVLMAVGGIGIAVNIVLNVNGVYVSMMIFGLIIGSMSFYVIIEQNGILHLLPIKVQSYFQASPLQLLFNTKSIQETVHALKNGNNNLSSSDDLYYFRFRSVSLTKHELAMILNMLPTSVHKLLESPIIENQMLITPNMRQLLLPSKESTDTLHSHNSGLTLSTNPYESNRVQETFREEPSLYADANPDEMVLTPLSRAEIDYFSGVSDTLPSAPLPSLNSQLPLIPENTAASPDINIADSNLGTDRSADAAAGVPAATRAVNPSSLSSAPSSTFSNTSAAAAASRDATPPRPSLTPSRRRTSFDMLYRCLEYGEQYCENNMLSRSSEENNMAISNRVMLASSLIAIRRILDSMERDISTSGNGTEETSSMEQADHTLQSLYPLQKYAHALNMTLRFMQQLRNGHHDTSILVLSSGSIVLLALQLRLSKRSRQLVTDYLLVSGMVSLSSLGFISTGYIVSRCLWEKSNAHTSVEPTSISEDVAQTSTETPSAESSEDVSIRQNKQKKWKKALGGVFFLIVIFIAIGRHYKRFHRRFYTRFLKALTGQSFWETGHGWRQVLLHMLSPSSSTHSQRALTT